MTENTYMSTKEVCHRFRCSSRTIFRKMRRPKDENPFPQPALSSPGSPNLFFTKDVMAWEDIELARTAMDRFLNNQEEISRQRDEPETSVFH